MTNPTDGRITSLATFTGTLATSALLNVVSPGNANSGINYGLPFSNLATNVASSILPNSATGTILFGQGATTAPSFVAVSGDVLVTNSSAIATTTIATHAVTFAKFQQVAGLSVLGVTGTATADLAGITGTTDQALRVAANGTSLGFGAINLATSAAVTGVLSVPNGGTNTSTLTAFGALFGNGTSTIGVTGAGTTAWPLVGNGSALAPAFAVLTVPGGGTGTTTLALNRVLIGNGTSTIASTNVATSGFALVGNGTSAAPGFAILGVPGGGLGTGTTTPFGVLFGGATATSQIQSVATTGSTGLVLTSQGSSALPIFTTAPLFAGTITPQGRITLASGTPVMIASQAAVGTAYYTPYVGNLMPLSDGAGNFSVATFSELSQPANSSTLSPAAAAASSVYDIFAWQQNATTVAATRGFAWQNATTRGATAALTRVGGVLLNTNTITNGPAAQRGTYLGTVATDGSALYNYVYGANASGGTAGMFGVWNMYNRVQGGTIVSDSSTNWTYANATSVWRSVNNNTTMRVTMVRGFDEDAILASYYGAATTGAGSQSVVGIGVNTTGAASGISGSTSNTSVITWLTGSFSGVVGLGMTYVQAIELTLTTATSTFWGNAGEPGIFQTGFSVKFEQ